MSTPSMNAGPSRPYWVVWFVLFGVLVVLVGGAFLLNSQFRTKVGVQQGSLSASSVGPASAPVSSVRADVASPSVVSAVSAAPGGSVSASNSPGAQEVLNAYQHYWQVYSDALLNLDTSHVGEVATGEELARIQQEVDGFRSRNHALRVVVEHHFMVFDVTASDAKVYDETHDRSYTVDPVTKLPPQGPDQADIEKDTYFLQNIGGTWKVTKSVRGSVNPA